MNLTILDRLCSTSAIFAQHSGAVCVGRDLKIPPAIPGCSKPRPAWPRTLPGMGIGAIPGFCLPLTVPFPCPADIPVFPTITATVTFQEFRYDEFDDSIFTIPDDYKEDPSRFPDL